MKNIKVATLLLAVMMLFTACSNIVNVTEVASINGESVSKGEFVYYLLMGQSEAKSVAEQQGNVIATEEDWETVMIDGVSAKQYAKDKAAEQLKKVMAAYAKGKAEGYALDEEGKKAVQEQKDALIAQGGGTYEYETYFAELGMSVQELNTVVERMVYSSQFLTKYQEEHEEELNNVTDEEIAAKYESEYLTAKHILFMFPQPEVSEDGTPVESEEPQKTNEEVKALAEDVLKKLNDGEDFDALMNEYSEDGRDEEGALNNTDGYLVQKNDKNYVPAFTEAAWSLENVGDYTKEIVESEYGYHIIKRVANATSGESYEANLEQVKSTIISEKTETILADWAEEFGYAVNEKVLARMELL